MTVPVLEITVSHWTLHLLIKFTKKCLCFFLVETFQEKPLYQLQNYVKQMLFVHVHPSSGVVSGHLFSQFYEISFSL